MKNLKLNILLVIFINLVACSSVDDFNNDNYNLNDVEKSSNSRIDATVYNGILKFESQSDFENSMDYLKNNFDEISIESEFENFYNQGFLPLYLHSDDESLINTLISRKNEWLPLEYQKENEYENSDDLIYSDYFASFLNYKRQIIVGDDVYMYTFNGVLKSLYRNQNAVELACNNNDLNANLPNNFPTQETQLDLGNGVLLIEPAPASADCGESLQPFDYFEQQPISANHNPVLPQYCNSSSQYFSEPGSTPSEDELLDNTFESVVTKMRESVPCDHRSSWVLFGTRRVCSERLEGRPQRRTRIEFSNVNYLFYEEISLKTKHQRRKSAFGLASWWNTQKADEIGLLVNNATFKIDHSNYTPQPPTSNFPNQFHSQFFVRDVDKTFTYNQGNGPINAIQESSSNFQEFRPFTPFNEDVTIQIFGDSFPFIGGDITFESEKLNDYFWNNVYNQAKSIFKSQISSEPTKFTLIFNAHSETIVQYIDLETRKMNKRRIHKILDDNFGGIISFNINLDSAGNPIDATSETENNFPFPVSFESVEKNLWNYDALNIDFVGYSRKGSNSSYVRMRYVKDE